MDDDKRTLGELYAEAGGAEDGEIELPDGDHIRLTVCGGVIVNDKDLGELPAFTVERVARQLREAATARFTDPNQNQFIKLGDD
ncbi:MAG: hypothetical protein IMZ46_13150 [Acidobacteria bacterium]|nr:hypothetical protein [Acidobacteriota bacterium]